MVNRDRTSNITSAEWLINFIEQNLWEIPTDIKFLNYCNYIVSGEKKMLIKNDWKFSEFFFSVMFNALIIFNLLQ